MAVEGGTRAVATALAANLGVAVAKFVAAAITGSTSMLAEGVHSVADSGNQVLLLIGGRRARQAPSALHPFGYARARYIYRLPGCDRPVHPWRALRPLRGLPQGHRAAPTHLTTRRRGGAPHRHGFGGLRAAHRRSRGQPHPGNPDWFQFVRRARSPELPVLLLEDSGALIGLVLALLGVGLSVLTGNGIYDGVASLCIGVLLGTIAVLLAHEITSLLIGEAALPEQIDKIHATILASPGVEQVIHLRTVHLGPDDLLVAAKIGISSDAEGDDIAATIDAAEARIRHGLPIARIIYLEPDIYRRAAAPSLGQEASPGTDPDRQTRPS